MEERRETSAAPDAWCAWNPLDPAFRDDPHPPLRRLRELPALLQQLESPRLADSAGALRELARHRLRRGELAREIATNTAPLSVAVSKKLLWESYGLSPEDVERKETALHHHLMGRPDALEGVMAYLERRPPEWRGSVAHDFPDWPE